MISVRMGEDFFRQCKGRWFWDLDGEFHLDSDGDGDIDGFGTCINTAMAEEIEDHINQYSWIQEPYVKVKANLTDAPNFKYQITQILEKGVGGY